MDKIKKFLEKRTKKERVFLIQKLTFLELGKLDGLNIVKIKNSDLYRLKVGRYRILFHLEGNKIIIDDIRLRDNQTYTNL